MRIEEEGPCINWWRIRATGFLHRKETTEQNKEGGNCATLKITEKGQH